MQPTAGTDNALEIGTALRGAVFGFTVASDVPSLGAELMGLQYRDEGTGEAPERLWLGEMMTCGSHGLQGDGCAECEAENSTGGSDCAAAVPHFSCRG